MRRIKLAVTLSLVPEARGGPFVFWNGLEDACLRARELGFDALEIFPPEAAVFRGPGFLDLLKSSGLAVAAIGTGAGWVKHKLRLTDPDPETRSRAVAFIAELLQVGASLGAPVIVGSMQGRWDNGVTRGQALEWLGEGMRKLDDLANGAGASLLIEPLNRYETNLLNRMEHAADLIQVNGLKRTRILADLFHMNIEEEDTVEALRAAGSLVGHVHFADSNRKAMGYGQSDAGRIARALRAMGYQGYVSAEVLPLPDGLSAARQTADTYRALFTAD